MRANDAPILLDVSRMVWRRWAGLRPTGIDRICLAWLDHFGPVAQATLVHGRGWHLLSATASHALSALLVEDSDQQRFRRLFVAWAAKHLIDLMRALPGRGRLWLNVGHTGLDLPRLAQWVQAADVRPVLMLHDIIPITHPQYCRAGEKERHIVRVKTLLQIAHATIGNSRDTLTTLNQFAAEHGLALPRAIAVWPGTPKLTLPLEQRLPATGEFIILGTIEGRKNHMLLLQVWERLVEAHGDAAPKLVIIGRRGWACDDVLARLQAGGFRGRVEEAGALDDAQIAMRLAGACALLFPSFAEGYGLPLVEAIAAGVPVIASNLDVFKEIGQGIPDLLPPDDVAAWADAIMAYAEPASPTRAAQMARMARFHTPDWPSHFEAVEAFLATL